MLVRSQHSAWEPAPQAESRAKLLDSFSYKQLAPEDDVSAFNCGDEEWHREVADFLKEDALEQQRSGLNKTFLFYEDSRLIGYTSLLTSSLQLTADEDRLRELPGITEAVGGGRKSFPAVLVGQFAVAADQQGRGRGSTMMLWVKGHVLGLEVGTRFLTLHVHTKNRQGRDFWKKQGFVKSNQASGNTALFLWHDLLQ